MKKLSQLSTADRRKRVQKLAANPGSRSKIPTQYLEGFAGADKLRAQRALNTRLGQEFVPGSGITNRDAAQQRDSATALRYGPQESELQQQSTQNTGQQQRLAGWYDNYYKTVQAGIAQQQQQQATLAGQLQGFAQGIGKADAPVLAQQGQQMQADAAARGATVDPQVASQATEGAKYRQALLAGFAQAQVGRAGADTEALSALSRRLPAMGQEAQAPLVAQQAKLGQAKTDLLAQKGQFGTQFLSDLKANAQKSVLEQAAFGLDQQKAQATADAAQARIKQTSQSSRDKFIAQYGISPDAYRKMTPQQRVAQKKKWARAGQAPPKADTSTHYGYDAKAWAGMSVEQRRQAKKAWDSSSGSTGPKASKVASNEKWRGVVDGAKTNFDKIGSQVNIGTAAHPEMHTVTPDDVRRGLMKKYSSDPLVAIAAWERHHDMGISPKTAAAMRKRGIGVPKAWLQKPAAPASSVQAAADAAKGALLG